MTRGTESHATYVVLDDDPTGVQTLSGVRVLLAWDEERVRAALHGRSAVHLITNTRSLAPDHVQSVIEEATRAALAGAPGARVVLRGDSTLRGHVLEEYLGVRQGLDRRDWPVLLLVPALPSAGRVTLGGMHLFERDGRRTPLHETEYAHDGVFAYRSARLLEWAEERSHGLFRANAGAGLSLDALRTVGSTAVADGLVAAARRGDPATFAPDAETHTDLELVAAGFEVAVGRGASVIVRCAPAFAGVLAHTTATAAAPLPGRGEGILVICGSYVAQTTRQLVRLLDDRRESLVEADVVELSEREPTGAISRLAARASSRLAANGLAVLATQRARPQGTTSLAAGERIAHNLALVVAELDPHPSVVIAKGGITSAATLRDGVGTSEAEVVGPVEAGVSRWAARWPDGSPLDFVVVPGNVGDDDLLARLVDSIASGSRVC